MWRNGWTSRCCSLVDVPIVKWCCQRSSPCLWTRCRPWEFANQDGLRCALACWKYSYCNFSKKDRHSHKLLKLYSQKLLNATYIHYIHYIHLKILRLATCQNPRAIIHPGRIYRAPRSAFRVAKPALRPCSSAFGRRTWKTSLANPGRRWRLSSWKDIWWGSVRKNRWKSHPQYVIQADGREPHWCEYLSIYIYIMWLWLNTLLEDFENRTVSGKKQSI